MASWSFEWIPLSNTNSLAHISHIDAFGVEKHTLNLVLYLSSKWNISFIWSEYKQPRKYVTLSRSDQSSVCHLHSLCVINQCANQNLYVYLYVCLCVCEHYVWVFVICTLRIEKVAFILNTSCGLSVSVHSIHFLCFALFFFLISWSPGWKRNRSMFLYHIFFLINFCSKQYRVAYQEKNGNESEFRFVSLHRFYFPSYFGLFGLVSALFPNLMAIGHLWKPHHQKRLYPGYYIHITGTNNLSTKILRAFCQIGWNCLIESGSYIFMLNLNGALLLESMKRMKFIAYTGSKSMGFEQHWHFLLTCYFSYKHINMLCFLLITITIHLLQWLYGIMLKC